jgi:gliding motility-associated-like protein
MRFNFLFFNVFIWLIAGIGQSWAQCNVSGLATSYEIVCGESVTLSHFGSTTGNISFQENFNSGNPTGWAFTQQATYTNPCSPGGVDGTTHIWMGDVSGVPRSLVTLPLNFGPAVAPAGGTICFDMLFSEQGDVSPCEGPDEPQEGVFLQYSTNNGTSWTDITYFDPNGGSDPQLINWNNWCFEIPPGALTNGVQFRWFQDADSGSEYDHWGIDNVEIFVNDPTVQYTWVHDGYTTQQPGDNPTPVTPLTTTTYQVNMTTSTGSCSASVTIDVVNPVVQVTAGSDQQVCPGDCINLDGFATVINDPGGITTFSNVQSQTLDASIGSVTAVNVNVQDLNMATIVPGSILEVCIESANFFGASVLPPFGINGVESLTLTLICPDGTELILLPANTIQDGGVGSTFSNLCFVPAGGNISTANPNPLTGTFTTSQPFNNFTGCTSNGVWTIEISTTSTFGTGTFDGWSITFDDPADEYTPNVLWSPTTAMQAGAQTTLTPQVCPNAVTVYTLTASDDAGCVTVSDNVSITMLNNCCVTNTPPIQGPANLCTNATGSVYSVSNTPGSTYAWTVPAGATITAGQGTNSITVSFGATGGDVSVIETINCGAGPAVTYAVAVAPCATCTISSMTAAISNCYTSAQGFLEYDVDGTIAYSSAPATGTLTVTNCFGQQQIFSPPFGTSQNFSFTGLPQDGNNCDFVAVFSDDVACTETVTVSAPPTITFFSSGCVIGSGEVTGTIEFLNPPTTGTLVVSIDDGTNTVQTTIQPPFVSPEAWTVTGLDPAAATYIITFYFSDFAGCSQTQSVICGCAAEAGSTTSAVNGVNTLTPMLCENDVLTVVTNNNFVYPDDEGPIGGFAYQPALVYLVFNCPPTPGVFPAADPCFVGVIPIEENVGDINDPNSLVAQVPPGTFTNGQIFLAPITLYHFDPITPNYIVNANCWDIGTVTPVTYLQPITSTVTPDCQANTVTVDLVGGMPANNGSVFTGSNLLPANASFVNTTAPNNGSIVIDGLANGDMYSFDVTDASGCAHQVSGGPFVALPIADAGVDATSCALSFVLQPTPSYGIGTWSGGPVGTTFTPNATTANATVNVPADGFYTFTWTENNGVGCTAADAVDITFSQLSIPAVVTGATCGVSDGQIVVAPQGGSAPYDYLWSSGGTNPIEINLPAGPVTVTVTDATGCSLDSTFMITMPSAFTFTTAFTDVTCFGTCDGTATVTANGAGPYTYVWTPNVSAIDAAIALCAGVYEVEITENNDCVQIATITVGSPTLVDAQLSSDLATVCIGQSATLDAAISGGTPAYGNFAWTSVPADPTLVATNQNPVVSPVVTTTYTFTSEDNNGCPSAPKDIIITVREPLTLDVIRPLAGPDTSICPYDFATIDLIAGGGDGNYSIFLLPDMVNPIALPLDTQPAVTTTFNFMVTDGCTTPAAFASSTVTILPLPFIDFSANDVDGCDVHTVQFTDLTQPASTQWSWNFGDANSNANTATVANPFHEFSGPGVYDISLTAWTAQGCTSDTTMVAFIEVYPLPSAIFDLDPSLTTLLNANVKFTDGSFADIATWAWNFGDGATGTQSNPRHQYSDTGTYVITLTVTTINGCTDVTTRELVIEPDFTFYIPNAFTPNNDRDNEGFRPYGEGVDWSTLKLSIYTRWGELIYYTADIDSPWDGSYKGAQVDSGVFVYRIEITDLKGGLHEYTGHVTLVR